MTPYVLKENTMSKVRVLTKKPIAFSGDTAKLERFFKLEHWTINVDGRIDDHVVWRRGHFVLPVVVTTNNLVVLVREAKKAAETVLYGLPAGALKKGEDPITAALREVEEETGYVAAMKNVNFVGEYYNNPDKSTEKHSVVLMQGAVRSGSQCLELGEDILEVIAVPIEEALKLVTIGMHRLALREVQHYLFSNF